MAHISSMSVLSIMYINLTSMLRIYTRPDSVYYPESGRV